MLSPGFPGAVKPAVAGVLVHAPKSFYVVALAVTKL